MKRVIATLVAVIALSSISTITYADEYGNTNYSLSPSVDETVYTQKVPKVDETNAVVRLDHLWATEAHEMGDTYCNVTFRVRNENHDYATNYVDIYTVNSVMPLGIKRTLTYFSGEGIMGNNYKLFASFDAGQVYNGKKLTGCTASGVWAP